MKVCNTLWIMLIITWTSMVLGDVDIPQECDKECGIVSRPVGDGTQKFHRFAMGQCERAGKYGMQYTNICVKSFTLTALPVCKHSCTSKARGNILANILEINSIRLGCGNQPTPNAQKACEIGFDASLKSFGKTGLEIRESIDSTCENEDNTTPTPPKEAPKPIPPQEPKRVLEEEKPKVEPRRTRVREQPKETPPPPPPVEETPAAEAEEPPAATPAEDGAAEAAGTENAMDESVDE